MFVFDGLSQPINSPPYPVLAVTALVVFVTSFLLLRLFAPSLLEKHEKNTDLDLLSGSLSVTRRGGEISKTVFGSQGSNDRTRGAAAVRTAVRGSRRISCVCAGPSRRQSVSHRDPL